MNPDCCTNCDFKTGFVVLEEICPICKIGILYGDVHTKGLLCSNGCKSFPFAVPFAGTRNCESYLFADYAFTITNKIKRDLILTVAKREKGDRIKPRKMKRTRNSKNSELERRPTCHTIF